MALKFDNTNNLKTPKPRSDRQNQSKNSSTNKTHIVGVRIDTKAKNTKKKVYYYRTTEEYKRGDTIRIKVPSGGTPKATIAVENSNRKQKGRVKELREE